MSVPSMLDSQEPVSGLGSMQSLRVNDADQSSPFVSTFEDALTEGQDALSPDNVVTAQLQSLLSDQDGLPAMAEPLPSDEALASVSIEEWAVSFLPDQALQGQPLNEMGELLDADETGDVLFNPSVVERLAANMVNKKGENPVKVSLDDTSSSTLLNRNDLFERAALNAIIAQATTSQSDVMKAALTQKLTPVTSLASVDNGAASAIANITTAPTQNQNVERPSVSFPLDTPFQKPEWTNDLGGRIKWMVGQNIQSAELRMNPASLGPIEVRISMQNEQMNVTFTAHHAAVRDALETSAPRLREMMMENGFELVNVDVSDHSLSQQGQEAQEDGDIMQSAFGQHHDDDGQVLAEADTTVIMSRGLVDYYI